jgi:hypothetical protein
MAVAPDWPGLEPGAKTAEAAIERLQSRCPLAASPRRAASTRAPGEVDANGDPASGRGFGGLG